MKKWIGVAIILMVLSMMLGNGFAEEKSSSVMTYKERMNLKGPVKVVREGVGYSAAKFAISYEFSKEGLLVKRMDGHNIGNLAAAVTVTSYDFKEREISIEDVAFDGQRGMKRIVKTIYHDRKKTFSTSLVMENKTEKEQSSGILGENGLKKTENFVETGRQVFYHYDVRGLLICEESMFDKYEYEYNSQGQEVDRKIYGNISGWESLMHLRSIWSTYNDKGELYSKTLITFAYGLTGIDARRSIEYGKYEYDHYGNWISRKAYIDGEYVITEVRQIEYYE